MLKVFSRAEGRGWEAAPNDFTEGLGPFPEESAGEEAGCCSSREAGHALGGVMLDSCLGISET